MDGYQAHDAIKALEQISERLGRLEELSDRVNFLFDGLDHIGIQLERIAGVMELDSDRFQEKKEREKWAQLRKDEERKR